MKQFPFSVNLSGLTAAPSQVWGSVRLVPLLRTEAITDLRLHPTLFSDESVGVVRVSPKTVYTSYVPHGMVARWSTDGGVLANIGTQLVAPKERPSGFEVREHRALVQRTEKRQATFLSRHLAVEGYLDLQFRGPSVAWPQWSKSAIRAGFSSRAETFTAGFRVPGLADALRVFEIHPSQCGVVVYTGEVLQGVFVMPHPDDYRLTHPRLLENLFGAEINHSITNHPHVPELPAFLDDDTNPVRTLADLRERVQASTHMWQETHTAMLNGLTQRQFVATTAYKMGRFRLQRFRPVFDPAAENHIGDVIVDEHNNIAYLSTLRLSVGQTKRGHLLASLGDHDWNLDATAQTLDVTTDQLVNQLVHAGFGELLRPDVIARSRV